MSLRFRVVLAIALVLISGAVVGAALAGWQAKQVLREELIAALAGGRQTLNGAFASLSRSDQPARDLARVVTAFDGARHIRASLVDDHGHVIVVSRPIPVRPAPAWFADLINPRLEAQRLTPPTAGYDAVILAPVAANDIAALWAEFLDLIAVLSGACLIGAALVWLTVGRALRPLNDFSAAFLRIGSGDYGARVREAGPLELVRLGRGVNDMAGRLAAMQARTHRLEDQLRTLQDEERADLARDLHDEIGPHLFAVNVDAAMARGLIAEGKSEDASRQVEAIQQAVTHMQRLVRDILGRLRPTELIELGLSAAIAELVSFWRARHRSIAFIVVAPEDERLAISDAARETLYRVIQEALNNAVRHGRPSRIEIEVGRASESEIFARVKDDGAPSGKPPGAGFGLIGMRERVAAARGRLEIDRGDHGWTVRATLPCAIAAEEMEEAHAA
jgi:two-component system sensor histidine kinase UhpB